MMPRAGDRDPTEQKVKKVTTSMLIEVFDNTGSPYDDFRKLKTTIKGDLNLLQNVLQIVKSDKKVVLHENWYNKGGGTNPYSLAIEVKPRFFKPGLDDFVRVEFEPRHQGDNGQTYTNQLVVAIGQRGGTFVSEDAVTHTDIPATTAEYQAFRADLFRTILQSDLFKSREERNDFASIMKNKLQQPQLTHSPG